MCLATSDIARRSSGKNINFSLQGLRQGRGTWLKVILLQIVSQLSSHCGLREVFKELEKATMLKTHEML